MTVNNFLSNFSGAFPSTRLRRLRSDSWIRSMVSENAVTVKDLILPIFVMEGVGQKQPISSMPGVFRLSLDLVEDVVNEAMMQGIPAVALFPVVPAAKKDEKGEEAFKTDNLIGLAAKTLKDKFPEIGIICDVALDPYTTHGHDGILKNNQIINDITIEALVKQALALAKNGADIVAPSDMMDGRVGAIRKALDHEGFENVKILSYAAKYASGFYGPFRDAIGSGINLQGASKATYQMDPANTDEALREVALDIKEGADMIMVKPGMPYLDIISRVKSSFNIPVFAYQVSGEYAMLKAAAANGWLDNDRVLMESMLAFKRAGASGVFTYAALEVAKLLNS